MIDWAYTNTSRINRIGYNSKVQVMYIDFKGSKVDIPYINVPRSVYKTFVQANDIDNYFEYNINNQYVSTEQISTSTVAPI